MKLALATVLIIIVSLLSYIALDIKDALKPLTYPCTECLRKDKIIYKLTIDSTHKDCLIIKTK
jgi:hypothetical protein